MSGRKWWFIVLAVSLLVVSCVPATTTPTSAPAEEVGDADLLPLTLAMGYIPSVQFAPFYVAQEKGYFREEGLDIRFTYGSETDMIKLLGNDELQFVVASGEQVILARAQGLPVTYAMRWFGRFPVVIFAPVERGLDDPQKLAGHTIGIPGLYGASYVAWKALIYAAGLDEKTITLESIGFTQAEAVGERVDAAVDYIVNGPVQLRLAGQEVDVIAVSDYIDLPANGLVTNETTIRDDPALVEKMVRAILRGLRDALSQPDEAFAISLRAVPEAGGENEEVNRAIFDASVAVWQQTEPLGASDRETWETAVRFMREMGLIETDVSVDALFTNQFIPGAGSD